MKPRIGIVGQGYVGKAYADWLEGQGREVVRYALEPEYAGNRERIAGCGIVLVAVPTPSPGRRQDLSAVRSALALPREGAIVVIKSTMLPGSTKRLQRECPSLTLLFSPEFLSAATAARDVATPFANIVGLARESREHRLAVHPVARMLPTAPLHVMSSTEAEIVKYAHNLHGLMQIVAANLMYDVAQAADVGWDAVAAALKADPYMPASYIEPVHKGGRGAGGPCFIKDVAALASLYRAVVHGPGDEVLTALQLYNGTLLYDSGKDEALLDAVYRGNGDMGKAA